MDIVEFSEAFRNFIIATATIITSWAAYTGIKTWKEELTGTTRFDIAKKITILLINTRNEYIDMRRLSVNTINYLTRLSNSNNVSDFVETFNKTHAALEYVLPELYDFKLPLDIRISELSDLTPEAESMFGLQFSFLCQKIIQVYNEVKHHYFSMSHSLSSMPMSPDKNYEGFKNSKDFLLNYPISITSDDVFITAINDLIVLLKQQLN